MPHLGTQGGEVLVKSLETAWVLPRPVPHHWDSGVCPGRGGHDPPGGRRHQLYQSEGAGIIASIYIVGHCSYFSPNTMAQ